MSAGEPRWIVSQRYDSIFFIGSVAVSFTFLAIFYLLRTYGGQSVITAATLVNLVFFYGLDQPHIFQTAARVYADREHFRRIRIWATLGFVGIVAIPYFASRIGGGDVFRFFFDMFGSYHIIRQNVGFMRAYARLNGDDAREKRWDEIFYYVVMIGCVLQGGTWITWEEVGLNEFFKTEPGARVISHGFADAVLYSSWIVAVFYLTRKFIAWRRGQKLNLPKLALMFATLILHHVTYAIVAMPLITTVLETAYHDVQYHAWMARFQNRSFKTKRHPWAKWLAASLAYGVTTYALSRLALPYASIAQNFVIGVILYHYVIDGVIWKFSSDPMLKATMFARGADSRETLDNVA